MSSKRVKHLLTAGGDHTFLPGGTADHVVHTSIDANGTIHVPGTVTLHGVTASDAAGNVYPFTGATWFGAQGSQAETYLSLSGRLFNFDFGICEAPQVRRSSAFTEASRTLSSETKISRTEGASPWQSSSGP